MKGLKGLLIFALFLFGGSVFGQDVCPESFSYYKGLGCLSEPHVAGSWSYIRDYCESMGGYLVSIKP